jgi:C4-dicarboxylate-specific signal transduction histidine kinase
MGPVRLVIRASRTSGCRSLESIEMKISGLPPYSHSAAVLCPSGALTTVVSYECRTGESTRDVHASKSTDLNGRSAFELNQIVLDAAVSARAEMMKHGMSLEVDLARSLPTLEGDAVLLRKALCNLLVGAIEAIASTRDAPQILTISTAGHLRRGLVVTVQDAALVLTPRRPGRLFDVFYMSKKAPRHGLGDRPSNPRSQSAARTV